MKTCTPARLELDFWDRETAWEWPHPAPHLWAHLLPHQRPLVCGLAVDLLLATPDEQAGAFPGRLFETLRARGTAASTPEERAMWHDLDVVLSRHVDELIDLRLRLAGRGSGDLLARLRRQHAALGETLGRLEALRGAAA